MRTRLRHARLLILPAIAAGVAFYLAQAAQDYRRASAVLDQSLEEMAGYDRRIEENQVRDALDLIRDRAAELDARHGQAPAANSDI